MGSASQTGKSALIFGASGVTGWAFVNEILHDYPEDGIWTKVHALTNRPLSQKDSLWPADPRLNIVSGIDLLEGNQEDLESTIKTKITGIEGVTHMYYLAYKAGTDVQKELEEAVSMFQRATTAIDHLCQKLEFVVLQTGAKMYGCHLLENHPNDDNIHVPLAESMPRMTGTAGEMLFYHPQLDWITAYAKAKLWDWCDTRPDIIIGFVPNQNFYSLGTSLGVYFSLFAEVEGRGAKCPFPGSDKSWVAKSNDSSSDMIARQTLYLSLNLSKKQKGQGYNVADAKKPESWTNKWPQLCQYFGLEGCGPVEGTADVREYIKKHIDLWHKLEEKYGLKKGIADSDLTFKGFEYFLLTLFDFDRQYDMTKMYDTGFKEERDVMQAWGLVFDRMKAAKMIPS